MKTKIKKVHIDYGYGFPVKIFNVPLLFLNKEWMPLLKHDIIRKEILQKLAHKKTRLTGAHIQFIRHAFRMTITDFAKRFCVTEKEVLKWENAKDGAPIILWHIEKDIRLFILERMQEKNSEIGLLYKKLNKIPQFKKEVLSFNLSKKAA